MLLSKLLTYLQDRWNRYVYKLRRSGRTGAELMDLIEMVDEETIPVNDPLFSRETLSQYVHKPNKFNREDRRKNVKSYFTVQSLTKTMTWRLASYIYLNQ